MQLTSITAPVGAVPRSRRAEVLIARPKSFKSQLPILFWSLSIVGAAGASISASLGAFGAAALCAVFAVLMLKRSLAARETGFARDGELGAPPEVRESEPVAVLLIEFGLLGGLVFFYRRAIVLELLSLVTLLGSFSAAYVSLLARIRRVPNGSGLRSYDRVVVLVGAFVLAFFSSELLEPNSASLGAPIAVPLIVAMMGLAAASHLHAIRLTGQLLSRKTAGA